MAPLAHIAGFPIEELLAACGGGVGAGALTALLIRWRAATGRGSGRGEKERV